MKKLTTIIIALLITTSAMAGNNLPFISFGLKAGFTSNQQSIDLNVLSSVSKFKDNASGFHLGGVARVDFPLLPIYVQGELLYDWGRYNNFTIGENTSNVTTNAFSVPVLLGVGIGSTSFLKIRANLGPVFNLVSTAKWSGNNNVNIDNIFRKQTVTWAAGVGLDIFRVMLDIRYNGTFSKNKIGNIGDLGSINARPTSWTFSLGYLF